MLGTHSKPRSGEMLHICDISLLRVNDLLERSQDNILTTTVDTITLQSDMTYTMQVYFSNLGGEFNITSNKNFSKLIAII